jgi:hypothetical protein
VTRLMATSFIGGSEILTSRGLTLQSDRSDGIAAHGRAGRATGSRRARNRLKDCSSRSACDGS